MAAADSEGCREGRRLVDSCGLAMTCSSEKAVDFYNKAVKIVLSSSGGCLDELNSAVEEDDGFVLGHCFLVRY